MRDGGMAEELLVPERCLVPLPAASRRATPAWSSPRRSLHACARSVCTAGSAWRWSAPARSPARRRRGARHGAGRLGVAACGPGRGRRTARRQAGRGRVRRRRRVRRHRERAADCCELASRAPRWCCCRATGRLQDARLHPHVKELRVQPSACTAARRRRAIDGAAALLAVTPELPRTVSPTPAARRRAGAFRIARIAKRGESRSCSSRGELQGRRCLRSASPSGTETTDQRRKRRWTRVCSSYCRSG